MNTSNELTFEQEFKLIVYKQKINKLSHRQARRYLTILLSQMLLKDNVIKYCIRSAGF
uniref:Uncharacterized protein ycf18 n=1 Tax=Hildenbrandia rivularis TaxID=135206 RepID=A0A1C9CFJ9_9FLOR|nr:phycobilisome degradation protein [Hildenbrandia rivularis]AOM67142.1 phycobilisome degradation protein [Hildenbrandia rivularis]